MSVRRLRPEEARLWAHVARTVEAAPGMTAPDPVAEPAPPPKPKTVRAKVQLTGPLYTRRSPRADLPAPVPPRPAPRTDPDVIEPNRKRRIARAPEAIAARLDLHGMDQDRARIALHAFVLAAHANGARAVLVITGKGRGGSDGVLRARAPEWLAEPAVRFAIAGVSQAEQRHGGAGALYVALKRRL